MKTGFPGVCGCIDCTHIAIVPPSGILREENDYPEHLYVNRKNYHSINTQLICDVNLKILSVNALFPGSTHDSHIWNNCNVLPILQELNRRKQCFYLLGDSGYALRPWLLTPIQNPANANEELYNKKQMHTRSLVERCNGLLKMRFRCLLKHRVLHYAPEKATAIINACVVLHNMCITYNEPEPIDNMIDIDFGMYRNNIGQRENDSSNDLDNGRRVRACVVRNFVQNE
ncbi:unnamed protein product [Macrosiphum euphorbiae]|uniref:DDE Tnp4 domain-containing protein n=1 Tax=Macrosiphum euphorbiae TaxID=13131 RepID=A0AAV0WHK2_9HEMI|nr:unnamed protein product [Macrosiphum euphorbiae]